MESVGSRLKKLRLEKGVSLEEVQKKTRVKLNILRAIEGDGLSDLNPVYLKGFLKIYCKFLNVKPEDYIVGYKEPQPVLVGKAFSREQKSAAKAGSPSFFRTVSVKLVGLRPDKRVKKIIVVFVAALVIIFLLFQLGKFIASRRSTRPDLRKPIAVSWPKASLASKGAVKPKSTQVTPKQPLSAASTQPKAVVSQTQEAAGIKLIIRAKQNCWVSLKSDGRLVFQRVLEKGRFETWRAKERFDLSVGNAGAIELEVDNRPFLNLGRKGKALKNIVITKDGLIVK